MNIFFLEKLRKIYKSLGKKEKEINDLITFKKFKRNSINYKISDHNFNLENITEQKIKFVAAITFYYNESKIDNLIQACKSLGEITSNSEIYIFTNKNSELLINRCKENLSFNVNFEIINQPVNDRLLPWYHVNLMKNFFKRTEITHFIYLEDDILLNKKNFYYWINSRKILKRFNLIPGFIRTEKNFADSKIYAIDFIKKNKIKNLPNLYLNKTYNFINHHYPYQGMYLYDRELMKEYLFGPSSNPDCGHGAYKIDFLDTRMINLDLMAKANIGLTYMNIPEGFYNRLVTLYNKDLKKIDKACCIEHLSQRYSNEESSFGNINLEDALS
jgi:hypothetical protein